MKNKNIFLQNEVSSCGACSIQSLVSFYGGYVPHEIALEDTYTDKNGTNAYYIVKALEKYGFISYGMRVTLDKINTDALPLIAHTIIDGYEHFMVIYNLKKNKILVMDPRIGKNFYTFDEFNKIFDNIVIIAKPNGKIIKIISSSSVWKKFGKELKNNKKAILKIIFLNILIVLLSLIFSFYIKLITFKKNIIIVLYIFLILNIIKFSSQLLKDLSEKRLSLKLDKKLNNSFLKYIFSLNIQYLINKRSGEILKKVRDISFIKDFFFNLITTGSINCILLLIGIYLMIVINYKLAFISLVVYLIYVFITILANKKLYKSEVMELMSAHEYASNLNEYIEGIESIKTKNSESYYLKNLENSLENYINNHYNLFKYYNGVKTSKNFMLDIIYLILMTMGVIFIKNNLMSIYDLIIISSIYSMNSNALSSVLSFLPDYMRVRAIYKSVCEFLDLKIDDKEKIIINDFKNLTLNKFSYSYNQKHLCLSDLSLQIKKGDKILINGPSGSGKSTLVKCLSRYLDDYRGSITIDGIELNNVCVKGLIVYVGQNEKLFKGTIVSNIIEGLSSTDYLYNIIDICSLGDLISLNNGLNGIIMEDGENFSAGEKARIILARALYKRPKILIIDETLAYVSTQMEEEIISKLVMMEDLTLIYITHRDKEELFNKIITIRKDGKYEIKGF